MNDMNDVLGLLAKGDIKGLIDFHHKVFGDMVMTAPTDLPPVTPPAQQTITVPEPPAPPAPRVQTFTAEDIEAARRQEKEKLYPELEALRQGQTATAAQLAEWAKERETQQVALAEAQRVAEAAAEERRQAELTAVQRLQEVQEQQNVTVQGLQEQLAQRDATLAREREYNDLMSYRDQALAGDVGQQIIPELRDMVAGNNQAEIDASISALAQRSNAILQQVATARQEQLTGSRGVGVTAPPVGPMDNNSGNKTFTAEEIRAMDMQTFAKYRSGLLGAGSQQHAARGMFG